MFSPLAPIQSDSHAQAAIESLAARVDAIHAVLAVLSRQAGIDETNVAPTLAARAALAEMDSATVQRIALEMDAISAMLEAGYAALESARKRGRSAHAATAMLTRESLEAFASALAFPTGRRCVGQ